MRHAEKYIGVKKCVLNITRNEQSLGLAKSSVDISVHGRGVAKSCETLEPFVD
jgi:hypothetical protein